MLRGADAVEKVLDRVRALGVRIPLDAAFGTGFSSLSHLMRLPLDKVKIDQSFTRQLGRDHKAGVVIENIARLSSQLGMVVTVEGIETIENWTTCGSRLDLGRSGLSFSKALPRLEVLKLFPDETRQSVA